MESTISKAEHDAKILEKDQENARLRNEIQLLRKALFGPRSEKRTPHGLVPQPDLWTAAKSSEVDPIVEDVEESPADPVMTSTQEASRPAIARSGKGKQHPGRSMRSNQLPVEEVLVEPKEDVTGLVCIGHDVSEMVVRQRERIFIRRYLRPKYVKPLADDETTIVVADPVQGPLPKSYADASLLAWILYAKFVLHLPFYRQAQDFKRRYDLDIPKSTFSGWYKANCRLLKPLFQALTVSVLSTDYAQGDETTMPVLTLRENRENKGNTRKVKHKNTHLGYMWVINNPVLGHVLFHYHPGRSEAALLELIPDFKGTLQCDGYVCYENYAKDREIKLVSCLAHIRRKFYEAMNNDAKRAKYALDQIGQLYAVEEVARQEKMTPAERLRLRKQMAGPIYYTLLEWVKVEEATCIRKERIGKALGYALNQLPQLEEYLRDGRVEIDNNLIENTIRPVALGRKNYLFAGSHDAARCHAMMYSFFASCKLNNLDGQAWLEDVLNRLPDHPINQIEELLPVNWKPKPKVLKV